MRKLSQCAVLGNGKKSICSKLMVIIMKSFIDLLNIDLRNTKHNLPSAIEHFLSFYTITIVYTELLTPCY